MRLTIPKLSISTEHFLKTCSYIQISNPHKNNEVSYARSINSGNFYPRFHIYIEKENQLNLHLDAKKPSYEGSSAHSGEYDSLVVQQEMERIKEKAEKFLSSPIKPNQLGFKKSFTLKKTLLGLINIFKKTKK